MNNNVNPRLPYLTEGRTPDKTGQFYCQVDETKTWRTNHVWSTSFVENAFRPNSLRNLRNQRQKICVNLCESVKSVAETRSIKNNQLCKTNPISKKPKMNLNNYMTKEYENKPDLLTTAKQTQSNPTLSRAQSRDLSKQLSASGGFKMWFPV